MCYHDHQNARTMFLIITVNLYFVPDNYCFGCQALVEGGCKTQKTDKLLYFGHFSHLILIIYGFLNTSKPWNANRWIILKIFSMIIRKCREINPLRAVIDFSRQILVIVDPRGIQLLNEWGFRPPLCTCTLNWASRTPWGWWDECTARQTQNSKFEPWRSEVEHATSWSRRLHTILNIYEWAGKKLLFLWTLNARAGFEPTIFDFPSRQL